MKESSICAFAASTMRSHTAALRDCGRCLRYCESDQMIEPACLRISSHIQRSGFSVRILAALLGALAPCGKWLIDPASDDLVVDDPALLVIILCESAAPRHCAFAHHRAAAPRSQEEECESHQLASW